MQPCLHNRIKKLKQGENRRMKGRWWKERNWKMQPLGKKNKSKPTLGFHKLGRMWRPQNASRGGQKSWKNKPGRLKNTKAGLLSRKGGWRKTSLLTRVSSGGEIEREVLISSLWYSVIGCVGVVHSCTCGSTSLLRGCSDSGTLCGIPREVVDAPRLSAFKRHLNNAFNNVL